MKDKCSYADRYQAKRKPACGCKACEDKWNKKLLEDINLLLYSVGTLK